MRLLVCGSRTFSDVDLLKTVIDGFYVVYGVTTVIHGAAKGADTLAGAWARGMGLEELAFRADWRTHGKTAGPIRNRQMLNEGQPDLVVAFIDKPLLDSVGTLNMVSLARSHGVRTIIIEAQP